MLILTSAIGAHGRTADGFACQKHPSVRDSQVTATFHNEAATCGKISDHFQCVFKPKVDFQAKDSLEITATREKHKGAPVKYSTPRLR